MTAVSAPFGMKPIYHPSGTVRPRALANGIASGYSSNIFLGDPVRIITAGTLNVGSGSNSIVGSFAGCDYVDGAGRPHTSAYWPASTAATNINAYFHDDSTVLYAIQSTGSIAQTAVGDQANITNAGTGSTATGVSLGAISSTLVGAGNQGLLQIVDLYLTPDNAWGDAFTTVVVRIANHQYTNPQTAI